MTRPARVYGVGLRNLNRLLLIALTAIPMFQAYGQIGLGTLNPSSRRGSAVDANGVRHDGKDYPRGQHLPWLDDIIQAYSPHYPYGDRLQRNQGHGIYRVTLDLNTGSVTKVTVLKSTGVSSLDVSSLAVEGGKVEGDRPSHQFCDIASSPEDSPRGNSAS
jgi:hypothetical protein